MCSASTAVAEATLLKSSLKSVCTVCRVKRISGWPAVTPAGHMVRPSDPRRQQATSLSSLSRLYSRRDAAFLKCSDSPSTAMAYTVTVWLKRERVVEDTACTATLRQITYVSCLRQFWFEPAHAVHTLRLKARFYTSAAVGDFFRTRLCPRPSPLSEPQVPALVAML